MQLGAPSPPLAAYKLLVWVLLSVHEIRLHGYVTITTDMIVTYTCAYLQRIIYIIKN